MSLLSTRISVVICAYTEDRLEKLIKAIESVKNQSLPVTEIIVVVDHNPGLYRKLQELVSGICLMESRESRGLSGARNTGIAAASGDFIAFLDDDAVAASDWMENLIGHLENENVLGVGGAVEPAWEVCRPAWFPEEFFWVVGCSYRGQPETATPVRNVLGASMCFRREVFSKTGNFHSGLGHVGKIPAGCEETELCIRARRHWPHKYFLHEPQSKVFHFVPAKRTRLAYFRSRCYSEGISKALVVKLSGSSAGLSSERTYTMKTLPAGIWRGLQDALHGDINGLGKAGVIVFGLVVTTWGYMVGTIQRLSSR